MVILVIIAILLIVFIVVLACCKPKMNHYRYYNVNSTDAQHTGYYNPSDLGYESMRRLRTEKEKVFNQIKHFVNAQPNAKVILNSGATESIATCINWARHRNKYGVIMGSSYDHSSVAENCLNQDMKYVTEREPNMSAVFLTHVTSRTGAINPNMEIARSFRPASESNDITESSVNMAQRPLVFVDVTQSITKIPVDMSLWRANALFFSLHKIGGPMNTGILVINDEDKSFVPLIAGAQNGGLRGGTLNETAFVEHRDIFKMTPYSIQSRVKTWQHVHDMINEAGLKTIEPSSDHLYNTILIETGLKSCPLSIIDELSRHEIHVGTASACQNERQAEALIRVSFIDPDDIDDGSVDAIIKAIKKAHTV